MAMLIAGCASSQEARPTEPASKGDARTTAPSKPAVGESVLRLEGGKGGVAIYDDGRVIWAIGDGDPGYLQMRLTPEAVGQLRSRAVSTGLFNQDQGLWLDPRRGGKDFQRGSMEVRRGDRSVIVVWGKRPSSIWSWAKAPFPDFESISAATAEQQIDVVELVAFFRDPTAWRLPSSLYVQPDVSPFVPSRFVVVYDGGEPDWSTLPPPAREIVRSRLDGLTRPGGCQVISADQAREVVRALTQAGIDADYDSQRGGLSFSAAGSFVHSRPALPHEVAC